MKNITVAALVAAPLLILAFAVPSFAADPAPTTCKDGTTTTSTGRARSGHGGVQKAAKTTAPGGRNTGCSRNTGSDRRDDDMQGSGPPPQRQGHLQRPWRHTERNQGQAGDSIDCRASCTSRDARASGTSSNSRTSGYRCEVIDGDQVRAYGHCQQYRSDRRDGQVQGRHLLQVRAPQRHVLESWWRG